MPKTLVLQKNLLSPLCIALRDHKIKNNFQDILNPLCIRGNTLKQYFITFSNTITSPVKEVPF